MTTRRRKEKTPNLVWFIFGAVIIFILWITCGGKRSMVWAACVNDSTDCDSTVTITQDSMPYTIPASNTYYRFEENLTATGTGIEFSEKNNWQLDGNDYSLTFSTDGGSNENGIHQGGGSDAFRIKNISILYGADSAEAHNAGNCDAIELIEGDSMILENLYITYGGYDACGIDILYSKDATVRQVTCSSMVHSQSTRSDYRTSGIRFMGHETQCSEVWAIRIDTCRMKNMLHSGFYIACGDTGQNVCPCKPLVYLNYDSIWGDGRNRNYTNKEGDPFGITAYTWGPGSYIKNCYINGIPSNYESKTTGNGGNGLLLQGLQGTAEDHIEICNNTIIGGFQSQSGGSGSQYAIALFIRWSEGEENQWSSYVDIHDNEFWGFGDSVNWPNRIETVRYEVDSGFQGIHFYNNQCYGIQVDSAGGHYLDTNYVMGIGAMDSTRANRMSQEVDGDTVWCYDNRDNLWYNNYYYANTGNPIEFGSQANHMLGGGGIIMFGDTVYRGVNDMDSAAVVFGRMTYRFSSTGSRIIDLTCLGHTKDTVVFWTIMEDDDCRGQDLTFQRQVEIVVNDSLDEPIEDADVWIWDNYDDTLTSKSTDADGKVYDTLTYAKYHYVSPEAGDTCDWVDSVSYNNFYIKASYDGLADSAILTVNLTWDGSDTIQLDTGGEEPSTGKGLILAK